MSSLFNDGDCGCNSGNAEKGKGKCKGCVCQILNELSNWDTGNICTIGRPQRVLIVNKGCCSPLDLGGSTTPTEFTVAKFDPDTCCAVLTYEIPSTGANGGRETRAYVTDCRSIAAVTCLEG